MQQSTKRKLIPTCHLTGLAKEQIVPGSFRWKSSSKAGSSFQALWAKEKLEFPRRREQAVADQGRGPIHGTTSVIKHKIVLTLHLISVMYINL
jgi:hypothetical protein